MDNSILVKRLRTIAGVLESTGEQLEAHHMNPHWRVGRRAILLDFARFTRRDADKIEELEMVKKREPGKKRSPIASVLSSAVYRVRKIKSKKGRGSYTRKSKKNS